MVVLADKRSTMFYIHTMKDCWTSQKTLLNFANKTACFHNNNILDMWTSATLVKIWNCISIKGEESSLSWHHSGEHKFLGLAGSQCSVLSKSYYKSWQSLGRFQNLLHIPSHWKDQNCLLEGGTVEPLNSGHLEQGPTLE